MATEAVDAELSGLVERALAEDLGSGDVTSEATVDAAARARARINQKQPGVLFGLEAAAEVFRQTGAGELERLHPEGRWTDEVPVEVAAVEGPARALLAAERTALNLLCHLSGVATLTARYVEAVRGTQSADPRHPQDHTGAAGAREAGGRGRRRAQPPIRARRRDPDQGEPRRPGGRAAARRGARRGSPSRARRSRWSAATRARSRRGWPPGPTGCCWTT